MSDMGFSDGVDAAHIPASSGEMTAGGMMRSAREAAGLHVAALAVSMKIPVKKLEALEADRLDLLHDAVFVRALAASVCRALKIDPTPVLNKLPLNAAPKLNPDEGGINAPFRTPGNTVGMLSPGLFSKPSVVAAMILVVAGIAIFFFPDIKMPEWASEPPAPAAKPADPAVTPTKEADAFPDSAATTNPAPAVGSSAGNETVAPPPAVAAPTAPAPAVSAVANTPVAAAVLPSASQAMAAASRPVAAASRPAPAASAPAVAASRAASAPTLPSTGVIVFKARGATWVKVVDAKGVVQLSKTLAEGDVVGASGALPLSVVIGRVDATDVEVRGQAFSLGTVSRDNVARFEVK